MFVVLKVQILQIGQCTVHSAQPSGRTHPLYLFQNYNAIAGGWDLGMGPDRVCVCVCVSM
ncbi:hypothetical protein CANARDRAFT_30026 [[Candida] arabinofermentans NRRL YB-2248]|uniref:Uncharacterized protein n=1 Tax=[Candida] arabinofermentans NRRL YB-2248 TaxID=983967 RepID=A0A1E4SV86_9ASCO|nr:hypothetical protein CANARDRAFT_30026 [[Candida] arabinofermentans NRRL YB-2248]